MQNFSFRPRSLDVPGGGWILVHRLWKTWLCWRFKYSGGIMREIHCLMLSLREIFVLEMNQCVARSLYLWYWGFCAWWVDVKSIVSVPVVALVSLVWATTSVGCALTFGFPLFSVVFLFSCFVLCFCTCVFPFPFPWCFCLWWWYLLSESHHSWLFMWVSYILGVGYYERR